jgi:ATP-dependent Clp protease ATP-binding subunit ClpC
LRCLTDERNRSALLVGPAGVGKTAVVQEVASRIVSGDVPEQLEHTPVWQVSGGRLTAGAKFFGDWQERILDIVDELESSGGILFVDNLAELVAATSGRDGSQGVAGLMYPHVESGSLSLVTELRPEQLDWVEQQSPTFLHALQRIWVEPMDGAETDAVLERVSYRLGRQHGVRLAPETRQKVISLVGRFRTSDALPGPAIELAERVAQTHREDAVEPESRARPELQPRHAVEAMASETGLPRHLLDPNTNFSATEVRAFFEERIFSQPDAVRAMTDLVTVLRAGINPPERPMGSYIFIGPTGVGKTQTALTLAEYLFGDRDRLLRFDMSEYQDRWSATRLVGRGKGDAGQLVRRVREEPFSVLLLDEIEKAHETVFDMLLQVLGEGRLSDGLGQTVSLTNTVVVMTSNLGAGGPSNLGFEGPDADSDERLERHYVSEIEDYFRPEFVGRLDRIVSFSPLGDDTARQLVERALEETLSREGLVRRNLEVDVDDAVVSHLVDQGFDERYGARPLRQTVEREITARLADFLARNADLQDATLHITLADGQPTVDTARTGG